MRTKEEISKEFNELAIRIDVGAGSLYIVEVLLDIRELLLENKSSPLSQE
jgi:hypothetical protein